MNVREMWKQFAQSDEGRQLAAQLEEAETDQLHKQGELDRKIVSALSRLAARADRSLAPVTEYKTETVYRARCSDEDVELTIKFPLQMVFELADMLTHYKDHNCPDAATILDSFIESLVVMMMSSVPAELIPDDEEDEDE